MACIRSMLLIGAILCLAACRGGAPDKKTSGGGVGDAREAYLRFHTDADTLAQAERNLRRSHEQRPIGRIAKGPQAVTPVTPPAPKAAPKPLFDTAEPQADPNATSDLLEALIASPDVAAATDIIRDSVSTDVLAQVEAVRILSARRPPQAAHELYIAAFTKSSTFVRERALAALLTAYPQVAPGWGRRLLATRTGRPEDRYHVAKEVIANKSVATYPLALEALAGDLSGGALYEARVAIIAAGEPIVQPLMRTAIEHRNQPNGFVARRLYRWIQGAGQITEAYYDSFHRNPNEYGVQLFRQRYGPEAKTWLTTALGEPRSASIKAFIEQALDELADPDAASGPTTMPPGTPYVLYLIIYHTPSSEKRILTDTPIWPDNQPGKTYRHTHGQSWVSQKTIGIKAEQQTTLRHLKPEKLATLQVDDQPVDQLDLRAR